MKMTDQIWTEEEKASWGKYVTVVFEGDPKVAKVPLGENTPYGKIVAIACGDEMSRLDRIETEYETLLRRGT